MDQEPTKETAGNVPLPEHTPPPAVDPRSFVLPNKEVHSPLNAVREGAGTLYNQEKSATLPKPPPPPPLPVVTQPGSDLVRPLETYEGDIERYVRSQNVTPVKAAAIDSKVRDEHSVAIEVMPQAPKKSLSQVAGVIGGLLLLVTASGAVGYAYLASRPLPPQENLIAPYIAVDATVEVPLNPGEGRSAVMNTLRSATKEVRLSVGLVGYLRISLATTGPRTIPAQTFLSIITPTIPPALLRTVGPEYLLGVHSFDVNQPFLIFSVDSYQGGYAGMLEWERTMQQDFSPLFDYTPTPRTTLASSTTARVIESPFFDAVIENHDARVVRDASGTIIFLWTLLDRSTVLITTNPGTVREVTTRLTKAPFITIPGR